MLAYHESAMRISQKKGHSPSRMRFRLAMDIGFLVASVLSFVILRRFQLEQISFFVTAPLLILFSLRLRDWESLLSAEKGQPKTPSVLKSLSNDYLLISDLALPEYGVDIDHLVIGPNGLFIVEVKNYSGYIRCNQDQWAVKSRRIDSLSKQAKRNSVALRSAIACLYSGKDIAIPYVTPLLVFANPEAKLRLRRPTVGVLRLHEIAEFVKNYAPKRTIAIEERKRIAYHLTTLDSTSREMPPSEIAGKVRLVRVK